MLRVSGGRFIDARCRGLEGVPALELLALASGGQIHSQPDPTPPGAIQRYPGFSVAWRDALQRVERLASLLYPLGGLDGVLIADLDRLVAELERLPEAAGQVLRSVDGSRTVAEVLALSSVDSLLTARILRRLMGSGVLRLSAPMEDNQEDGSDVPRQATAEPDPVDPAGSAEPAEPLGRPAIPREPTSALPTDDEVGGAAVEAEIRRWLADEDAPEQLLSDVAFSSAFAKAETEFERSQSSVPTNLGAPSEEALAELAEPSSPDLRPRPATLTREVRTASLPEEPARSEAPHSSEPLPQPLPVEATDPPKLRRSTITSARALPARTTPEPSMAPRPAEGSADWPPERLSGFEMSGPPSYVGGANPPVESAPEPATSGPATSERTPEAAEPIAPDRQPTALAAPEDDEDDFLKEAGVGDGLPGWALAVGVALLGLLLGTVLFFLSKDDPPAAEPDSGLIVTSTGAAVLSSTTATVATATTASTPDAGVDAGIDAGAQVVKSPGGRPLVAGPDAPADVREAEAKLNSMQLRDAAKLLSQLRKSRPQDPAVWILSGQLAVERGQLKSALVWADRALALDRSNFRAWVLKGSVLQFRGRNKAAKRAYQRGLNLAPDHPMSGEIRMVVKELDRSLNK